VKLIVAIIKPFKVEEVTAALHEVGVTGITLTEVRGHGRQRGHTEVYRGSEYRVEYVPKVRLDVLVDDANADAVSGAIATAAKTGSIGDGKLWVVPIESLLRIRTGEIGEEAL